ncbi:MAG: hypothetical protein V4450_10630 [Bacteroidota bacterium]
MKHLLLAAGIALIAFTGCMKDAVKEQYTFYRPVYKTRDEVKANIRSSVPVAIQQPGKIIVKDGYVFLNEIDKGIHVINISDPANPVNTAFIEIPGCVDLAINGPYLYADCYTDLVTLDITDPKQVMVKQFLTGVFPNRYYQGFRADTSKVIREWMKVDTTIDKRFTGTLTHLLNKDSFILMYSSAALAGPQYSVGAFSSAGVAIAGSMARFGLLNKRMYAVSQDALKVFNLTIPTAPTFVSTIPLQQGNIETIFPFKNNVFIGSQTGMFVYNVSDPDRPQKLSQFTHARSCDPVIADDNYAYVTLSGGSACGGFSNQLDVIDIKNISNPMLVKSYALTSPRGLSKDGNLLLICDGKTGLKILDATNANTVSVIKQVSGFEGTDVIALGGVAIVTAKDGIYFIDYSNIANASVVGKLLINSK